MSKNQIKVNRDTDVTTLINSQDIRNAWKYAICTNHTAKMENMISISTSCLCNDYCKSRLEVGHGICSHCFSEAQLSMQPSTRNKLEFNTRFLTFKVWDMKTIPYVNALYFRFEAFGDLQPINKGGLNQVQNYFNLARKNKNTKFALWTKNPWIIKKAIENGIKVPSNVVIVYSILATDFEVTQDFENRVKACYPFVNKLFACYSKEYATAHNVAINCGARSCFNCHRCYSKSGATVVTELIK